MKALNVFGRSRQPVVYEVRLEIDPAIVGEYDDWLQGHVREMLAFPGFQQATVYRGREMTAQHRVVRTVAYSVRTQRELDSYLRTHAKRMRDDGLKRFGARFTASRRMVPAADYAPPEDLAVLFDQQDISGGLPICANCLEPVDGRYCRACGQEDRTYVMSVFELASEFIGELLNFDSKLFRTLRPLLFRPGFLTNQYVIGKRHQYLSPVRMYIFISLVFFFLFAMLTDFRFEAFQVDGARQGDTTLRMGRDLTDEEREEVRRAMRELETSLGVPLSVMEEVGGRTAAAIDEATREGTPEEPRPRRGFRISEERVDMPDLGSAALEDRLQRGAEFLRDNPAAFARASLQHIPAMMFIFLPLIAMALKVLYVGSRRYYAEHLVFTLHFHSAAFVLLLVWLLFLELKDAWAPFAVLAPWVTALVWLYLFYYLYKSMRVVYGQGRFFTLVKFTLLQFAYFSSLITTLVFTLLYTMYKQA